MPEPRTSWIARALLWGGLVIATATVAVAAPAVAPSDDEEPTDVAGADDACGETILKADGTPWVCTFADDFEGDSLDPTKWDALATAESSFRSGPECYLGERPENVEVSDGRLRLTARQEPAPLTCQDQHAGSFETEYTGASVSSTGRFSQTYGRFEIRAKVPAPGVAGLHEAFWLWPDNPLKYGPWPYSGEIDIAEGYSLHSDRMIPFIHYVYSEWDWNVTNNYCVIPNLATEFHTYVLEWTTEYLRISYDGQVCIEDHWKPAAPQQKPQPFDHPFFVVLTQALGVEGTGNAFQPGVTPLPATTEVEYVRVWQ